MTRCTSAKHVNAGNSVCIRFCAEEESYRGWVKFDYIEMHLFVKKVDSISDCGMVGANF